MNIKAKGRSPVRIFFSFGLCPNYLSSRHVQFSTIPISFVLNTNSSATSQHFLLDNLECLWELFRKSVAPTSCALILPIPLGQRLEQFCLGKLWQLILLLLPVNGIPKLHPENILSVLLCCTKRLTKCNLQHSHVSNLSPKSLKSSCCASSLPQTLDIGCWKTIGAPPEIQEVPDGWGMSSLKQ